MFIFPVLAKRKGTTNIGNTFFDFFNVFARLLMLVIRILLFNAVNSHRTFSISHICAISRNSSNSFAHRIQLLVVLVKNIMPFVTVKVVNMLYD